jgi:AhpD family alkylhydroperoxidase
MSLLHRSSHSTRSFDLLTYSLPSVRQSSRRNSSVSTVSGTMSSGKPYRQAQLRSPVLKHCGMCAAVHIALLAKQREDELASLVVRRWQSDRNSSVEDRLQVERQRRLLLLLLLLILRLELVDGVANQFARGACCWRLAAVADVERRFAFVAGDARACERDVAVGVARNEPLVWHVGQTLSSSGMLIEQIDVDERLQAQLLRSVACGVSATCNCCSDQSTMCACSAPRSCASTNAAYACTMPNAPPPFSGR